MNWELVNGYTINFNGTHLDKKGWVVVDTLKQGEYILGVRDFTTGLPTFSNSIKQLSVSPNPATEYCSISFNVPAYKNSEITVSDMKGNLVFRTPVFSYQEKINWDVYYAANGTYIISLVTDSKVIASEIVVVNK
jgi:hypothetical protein